MLLLIFIKCLTEMLDLKVRIKWLASGNDEKNIVPAPRWSAWDRLQPLITDEDLNIDRSLKTWMRSERMRTSSPELCRRLETTAAAVAGAATPLPPAYTEIINDVLTP